MIPLVIIRYIVQLEGVESITHHVASVICMFNSSWIAADFDESFLVFLMIFKMKIVFYFVFLQVHDQYHITC